MKNASRLLICASLWLVGMLLVPAGLTAAPAPPTNLKAFDAPLDDGSALVVQFDVSADGADPKQKPAVESYLIKASTEPNGLFQEVGSFAPTPEQISESKTVRTKVSGLEVNDPVYLRVYAVGADGSFSSPAQLSEAIAPRMNGFDFAKLRLLILLLVICGSVIYFINLARRGYPLTVRKIAGLEAMDEAVGRATEMGRKCLFIPGVLDINDIQTIAGLNILSRIARTVGEFDAEIEVPTSRSLVMTAASETIEGAFLAAGRPDAFDPKSTYYVTDEQFGYVAYVTGWMVREKPSACFYFGAFFAESLILAETGNAVGAIQVAGTAQPSQLPFFVAACDYTLIGEEMFAASAYLSGSPEELGSLKGQDMGKVVAAVAIVVGCFLAVFTPDLMNLVFFSSEL